MKSVTNIERDRELLNLILNLDFANNLLSFFALLGSLFLAAWSWNIGHYSMLVCSVVVSIYVYHKYFGGHLDNMHRLLFVEKPLTKFLAKKHQSSLALNFSNFLSVIDDVELFVDSWELEKLKRFLVTKQLDNPTAFIICDLYRLHLDDKAKQGTPTNSLNVQEKTQLNLSELNH